MKQRKTFIIVAILLVVLLLGIGYAVVSSTTLEINGSAKAEANANFVVKFDQDVPVSTEKSSSGESASVEGEITNDTEATITISGLTTAGDTASATYTIKNESDNLAAKLSAVVDQGNTDWFDVKYEFAKDTIETGDNTTIKVTATLKKTPITQEDETNSESTIKITITADPQQPAE